jgi:hypothetical protein
MDNTYRSAHEVMASEWSDGLKPEQIEKLKSNRKKKYKNMSQWMRDCFDRMPRNLREIYIRSNRRGYGKWKHDEISQTKESGIYRLLGVWNG